jgi:uncharacterized protein YabE (DUF348 family)
VPSKSTALVAGALGIALLAGGTTAATALHKDLTLEVDGKALPAGGFALTVADVLANHDITLGERDLVYPALTDPVADGQTITVAFSKQVTLNVDGEPVSFYTTAAVLDDALKNFQLHELPASKLSVSRSAALPRTGLSVEVTTPKEITLKVAGDSSTLTTTADTVSELLAEQGVVLDADDRLEPAGHTEVAEDLKVVVDRVEITTKTKTEKVKFGTVKKKDSSLWKGESRLVSAGKNGKAERTYEITKVNGKQTDSKLVTETILKEAVDAVTAVGTKTTSDGVGLNLARSAMWDRIAKCESGNRWSINTGNGYYGGLQFNKASWNANGGRDFAALPHQASRAEQITVANRYYAKAGLKPWGCRHAA